MTAPMTVVDSTASRRLPLHALVILIVCSVGLSTLSHAQQAADPGTAQDAAPQASTDVQAELEAILKANKRCLRCHSRERTKTMEDGGELSLQIHSEDFLASVHGEVACVSCHEAISNRKHPSKSTNITISSKRDYSLELNQSCRKCHDQKFVQYEGSIHSSLVAQGSEKAPLCTDCHSAHAVQSMTDYQTSTGYPCKQCHGNIYNAYVESVHGTARMEGNVIRDEHIQAPICSDCHESHAVTAVAIGEPLRSQCFGCHENVPLLHSQWLPNAGLHLDIVSCAVCHAPFAKHRFDLHMFDAETQAPLERQQGLELFTKQLAEIEEAGGSVDPLAVWKLIEASEETSMPANISLRGRMEVRSGVWAHQIASRAFAVRTCDSCHQSGRSRALDVTVSVPGQDGRVQRFATDRDELGTVSAAQSASGFLGIGDTRDKILDILVLLALIAGFAIPIGHYTLGQMIKEKLEKGEH